MYCSCPYAFDGKNCKHMAAVEELVILYCVITILQGMPRLLDVVFADHIIIGGDAYFSFHEASLL